jgi:hypothetical protein
MIVLFTGLFNWSINDSTHSSTVSVRVIAAVEHAPPRAPTLQVPLFGVKSTPASAVPERCVRSTEDHR